MALVVLWEKRLYAILHVDSKQTLTVNSKTLLRENIYSHGSTGRLLLAHLKEDELRECISLYGMPGEHWDKIDTLDTLYSKLADIRKKGFAKYISREASVCSLSVVIKDMRGNVCAALGTYFPKARSGKEREKELIGELQKTARDISDNLKNYK